MLQTDRANGLIPFIFIMTLGTTSTCAFDPLGELGPICQKEGIWVHIDSAYAGSFMLCPEYRYIGNGLKYVDSFNMNAHKTLQINFDCSPMWFKDGLHALRYFELNPLYLKYDHQSSAYDYRLKSTKHALLQHLQIALGRRFRSLKIWFVLRKVGVTGLQKHLRNSVHLAEYFEELLREDGLFELFVPRLLGLNSTNEMNELLNHRLDEDRRIHLVASAVHGTYFLRLVICSPLTTRQDVAYAYSVIKEVTEEILKDSRLLETPN
ncbi:unnamed protein product [Gongylonema pulchrum]|uniref:Aromatic-L-amino-acid decarboxylase n=1 Tax=Gongylonema pulchrum TaxID=637853 RepID=A0A183CZ47_9BILA|nr:unnamed protein product [Gongylonema pulchrum]